MLDDILEGREIQSEEVIYLSKGGRSVQVLYSAAALKNDDAFEGIMFLAKDITRYKQAKVKTEELEENLPPRGVRSRTEAKGISSGDANFLQMVEKSPDGFLIVDSDGVVQIVNPALESLLGREREDIVGSIFGFPRTTRGHGHLLFSGTAGSTGWILPACCS